MNIRSITICISFIIVASVPAYSSAKGIAWIDAHYANPEVAAAVAHEKAYADSMVREKEVETPCSLLKKELGAQGLGAPEPSSYIPLPGGQALSFSFTPLLAGSSSFDKVCQD